MMVIFRDGEICTRLKAWNERTKPKISLEIFLVAVSLGL